MVMLDIDAGRLTARLVLERPDAVDDDQGGAVTAVTVYDGDGEPQAVDLDGHLLDGHARPARLWLRDVPQPGRAMKGIEVELSAGFGESGADLPETLKRAMLTHVAAMYACRGAVAVEAQPAIVPPGYERLIAPFCRRGL